MNLSVKPVITNWATAAASFRLAASPGMKDSLAVASAGDAKPGAAMAGRREAECCAAFNK